MTRKTSLKQGRHQKPDARTASGDELAAGSTKEWNYIIGIRIFQGGNSHPAPQILPMVNGIPAEEPIPGMVCQAARTLLGLSQADLSEAANVSKKFVNDFENGFRVIGADLIARLRTALESEGAQFVRGEDCVGVITHMSRTAAEQRSRSPRRNDQGDGTRGDTVLVSSLPPLDGTVTTRKRGRPRKAA